MPEIIKGKSIVADDWLVYRVQDGQPARVAELPSGKIMVPLSIWKTHRYKLIDRDAVGVWLSDTDEPGTIARDLEHFDLVAVEFPKFANGRGYSTASLLRNRYGYRGELRAIGDVLQDQLFYLARVGFDSFAVRSVCSLEEALNAFNDFSVSYQGSTDQPLPLYRRLDRSALPTTS